VAVQLKVGDVTNFVPVYLPSRIVPRVEEHVELLMLREDRGKSTFISDELTTVIRFVSVFYGIFVVLCVLYLLIFLFICALYTIFNSLLKRVVC